MHDKTTTMPDGFTIIRHRFSVTQGEVSIEYHGDLIARHYGDDIELVGEKAEPGSELIGGFAGRGDAYWHDAAQMLLACKNNHCQDESFQQRAFACGWKARAELEASTRSVE